MDDDVEHEDGDEHEDDEEDERRYAPLKCARKLFPEKDVAEDDPTRTADINFTTPKYEIIQFYN